METKELKELKEMVEHETVEYNTVALLIMNVIDFDPNYDDYKHFECIRLPVIGYYVFYWYSTYTSYIELINDINIDDNGNLWMNSRFEATYRDKKDSEGKLHNEELDLLKFIDHHNIKVVNLPGKDKQ